MRSSSYAASVINVPHNSTTRSQQRSELAAHHPPVVSAARSRLTGYSCLVKRKKGCRKSGLFVLRKKGTEHKEKQ